jgi:GAF domain-containing protein
LSRSEIVVPVFHHEEIAAVLDVDSEFLNHFDETDEKYLSEIAGWIKF